MRNWYYEVILTDIYVNSKKLPLNCQIYNKARTIVDSGTTNFRLENEAFNLLIIELKKQEKVYFKIY